MTAVPDPNPLATLSSTTAALVANAAPSLVSVHSHRSRSSGFVSKPNLVVTADEALADEGDIDIVSATGQRRAARIVGRDPTTDVALLSVENLDAPALDLSDKLPVAGGLTLAVGMHDGQPLAALGVVALSGPAWRSMRGGEIDVRIELGVALRGVAEGGVALDASGDAFGMAVLGPRRRTLVIPTATIARVAGQLEAHGRVPRGYLGLGLQLVRLDAAGVGAMVMSVDAAGPGAGAGIHQGDIIVAWNGQPLFSVDILLRTLGSTSVGTALLLSVRRGAETREVSLVVGERPAA